METKLADGRAYVAGDEFTAAGNARASPVALNVQFVLIITLTSVWASPTEAFRAQHAITALYAFRLLAVGVSLDHLVGMQALTQGAPAANMPA